MKMTTIHLRYLKAIFAGALVLSSPSPAFAHNAAEQVRTVEEDMFLALHNEERFRLSLPPLVWDPKLANAARGYAKKLANEDKFEHAPQSAGDDAQGENLWMGTRGFYKSKDMVGSWIEESEFIRSGIFPNISSTGDWTDVGHYTQLISVKTKYVGCGLEKNAQDEYLVCRYFPAGNEYGEVISVK
jgi:hypothetical protein